MPPMNQKHDVENARKDVMQVLEAIRKDWEQVKYTRLRKAHQYYTDHESVTLSSSAAAPAAATNCTAFSRCLTLPELSCAAANGSLNFQKKKPATALGIPKPKFVRRIRLDSNFRYTYDSRVNFIPTALDKHSIPNAEEKEEIEEYLNIYNIKKRFKRNEADFVVNSLLEYWARSPYQDLFRDDREGFVDFFVNVLAAENLDKTRLERKLVRYFHDPESVNEKVFAASDSENSDDDDENDGEDLAPVKPEIVHDTLEGNDPDYLEFIDTPRKLYCPRCRLYCCNLHDEPGTVMDKPSLQLQYEAAIEMERRRTESVSLDVLPKLFDSFRIFPQDELSPLQKTICRRVFLIYQGDFEKVAAVLGAPRHLVEDFCKDFKVPSDSDRKLIPVKPIEKNKARYYSVNSYPTKIYNRNHEYKNTVGSMGGPVNMQSSNNADSDDGEAIGKNNHPAF